jgi:alkylated DNA repair dioxygenase AlkB
LYKELVWRQDQINFYGKLMTIPRLQAWHGDEGTEYSYSQLPLLPLAWTPLLLKLKHQVSEFCRSNFNAILANCYRDHRNSVSWHSDNEAELGVSPVIASLFFGSERAFHFKHKQRSEKFKLPLQSGSLLLMSGDTQKISYTRF